MIFNHSGNIGDVLYSLNFARELAEANGETRFCFNLQKNVPSEIQQNHPCGKMLMDDAACAFLRPLLEFQPYIAGVSVSEAPPAGCFDLSRFRKLPLYHSAGDVRYYYYPLCEQPLPLDFSIPRLDVPADAAFTDKIVITRSARYHNPYVSYQPLQALRSDIVFIGLPREHQDFCNQTFPVEYYKVKDALEAASIMKGAKCVIGNQTGLFAIAEQLKVPRILESCQVWQVNGNTQWGLPNVIHFGGRCKMAISDITPQMVENVSERTLGSSPVFTPI